MLFDVLCNWITSKHILNYVNCEKAFNFCVTNKHKLEEKLIGPEMTIYLTNLQISIYTLYT